MYACCSCTQLIPSTTSSRPVDRHFRSLKRRFRSAQLLEVVGVGVGDGVGDGNGDGVGEGVGACVGDGDGSGVGAGVGWDVGRRVG